MDIDKIVESGGEIFRTYFPDSDIQMSYRLLSLKEYRVFKSLRDGGLLLPETVSEMVFERCFLGNSHAISDNIPAGITPTIGGLILWLSGDCDSETLLADITRLRQEYPGDTVFEYMRATILTALPSYTIEDMESWSRQKMLRYFVIAENILSSRNSEYTKMDLKKVSTSRDKRSSHGIDFEKENRAISRTMGHPDSAQNQLSQEQLKRLEVRRNLTRRRTNGI